MSANKQASTKKRKGRQAHSASKPTSPINKLRGAIGDQKNWGRMYSALDSLKNDASPRDFDRMFKFSMSSLMTPIALASAKPIKKPAQIQSVVPLDTVNIYREIAWATTLLLNNTRTIETFLSLRNQFLAELSQGNYSSAVALLDKIDEGCGYSLWTLELRIATETLAGGFERQKAYVNNLIARGRRTFVAFFASHIGERNEARVTKQSFETRLRERAKTWNTKTDQLSYITYKLIGAQTLSLTEAADIICYEASSSIIDLYETYIDVLLAINESPQLKRDRVLAQVEKLGVIDDHCLNNLRVVYSTEKLEMAPSSDYLNHFLSGEYAESARLISDRLLTKPDDPVAILLASKLIALGFVVSVENNGFLGYLLPLLSQFLLQDNGAELAAQALERLSLNLRCLPISACIANLLNETSISIIGEIAKAAAVRSKYPSVLCSLSLLGEQRSAEMLTLIDSDSDATWQYETLSYLGPINSCSLLSREAACYAQIRFGRIANKASLVFSNLDGLRLSELTYFRQEESILRSWFLNLEGDIYGAIQQSVSTAVSKPALIRSLPFIKLFEHRGFRDLKQLEREPCLAIGLFLYITLTHESTKDVSLKVAWKQFHKAHGVSKPSELRLKFSEFDSDQFLFFLRNVCTQEIMEMSSAFSNPTDLDRERLQICILLSELDTERCNDYDDEIIELTRRLSIEDGVQQVESSRVYVDMLGLQRWCHQVLNEQFLRYRDYANAGIQAANNDLERTILAILKKADNSLEILSFLDNYDINADMLLAELIEECANQFLSLPRFGLDAYLGSRVRHGSLEGAFRNPLEKRLLITKIESTTNQYEPNLHWLSIAPAQDYDKLNKLLNSFSQSIDSLLDGAISRFVHVRSVDNPDGLISPWPKTHEAKRRQLTMWLLQAKSSLSKEATVEQFVEYCATTFFWPALKESLSEAAEFVNTTLAGEILRELNSLDMAVEKVSPALFGFSARIAAAKEDINAAASKVSRWFAPPQFTNLGASYLLKTGIEIGITSLKHLRPQFETPVEWEVDERANVLLTPTAFQLINDVAFLIFGNILKHSGYYDTPVSLTDRPPIQISIRWKEPNSVEVEVQNAISPCKDISLINENVRVANEQIRDRQFESVARRRNKTGLVRLASLLNYEGSDDKLVEFGMIDDAHFRVMFAVPIFLLTSQST